MNGNSKTFLLVLLGMLTAFGPFVTDIRQFIASLHRNTPAASMRQGCS
ncbi:hypothetical protein [uncultured Alistipes sp.]